MRLPIGQNIIPEEQIISMKCIINGILKESYIGLFLNDPHDHLNIDQKIFG
jgi:hypothetical protein